jgi:hypothetical protein
LKELWELVKQLAGAPGEKSPSNFWNSCPDCFPVNRAVYGQAFPSYGRYAGRDTIVVSYQAHFYFVVRFDKSRHRSLFHVSRTVLAQSLSTDWFWSYNRKFPFVHRGILLRTGLGGIAHAIESLGHVLQFQQE